MSHEQPPAFDFGLCQIWLQENRLVSTPAYRRDAQNRRLTYYPENNKDDAQRARSKDHLTRLQAKYPDWAFHRAYLLDNVAPATPGNKLTLTKHDGRRYEACHGYTGKGDAGWRLPR